ncbi:PREDICTED: inter-alpha-trypsin inhibitor heavy chain H3-like isoform X2 [Ipomoea nil]|uniref:inter-alpha-trypsin inhibitor heavy chain H3-like isoform X2 n=1 Tax=Ipomoea nil TaxID=35883 RepID=UPI000901EC9C|nr:PREDICTED: inter-alpha-trypsin inhibitor heavy chain H3-like isoform X2 [Ipomoea nil]
MAEEFANAVEDGLRLSKRIYFGKDRAVAAPKPITPMEKAASSYLPSAPMLYAVIENPAIVDNPDIPSYQPHVHGRCDPPALIPLQMNAVSLQVDCYLDTAFVTLTGSWRVHCVMGSRSCDCCLAIPMGEQGSILGVEVEVPRELYCTEIIAFEDQKDSGKVAAKVDDGNYLKPNIFTLKIPQIDGGTNLSVTIRWSQKLLYHDGQFTLNIPFNFPEYVTPAGKKISKKEKISLNANSCPGAEVLCKTASHPIKELRRHSGKQTFLYEADVLNWSSNDFVFAYTISTGQTYGGVLLQSPGALDIDQREMFCCYLFPVNEQSRKVFRKEVVFVVDISGSMRGKPIEDTKAALFSALFKLDPQDSFNIITFSGETYRFSSSLVLATKESIQNAMEWISANFIAGGDTNILNPLNQAIEMLSDTSKTIPIIFLITDGAVEDERHICDVMKSHLTKDRTICPRVYTLGVGRFCNHYFLHMLAMLSRGFYDAAHDGETLEARVEGLFAKASSIFLANIAIDFGSLDLEDFEVYPSQIPDLSSESPLILSGRYRGVFPDILTATGSLADMSNLSVDLKVQEAEGMPLDKVLAPQQIMMLTAQAWFTEDKELEEKIAQMSVQNSIVSEYTRMALVVTEKTKGTPEPTKKTKGTDKQKTEDPKSQRIKIFQNLGHGFGNLTATAANTPAGVIGAKPEASEVFVKAASNCCGKMCHKCCCMCCIQACSKLNDQCAIVLTQCLTALACLSCCTCCELCCSTEDG